MLQSSTSAPSLSTSLMAKEEKPVHHLHHIFTTTRFQIKILRLDEL
jgi:hypothetical protein